jgi:hypothetical protein
MSLSVVTLASMESGLPPCGTHVLKFRNSRTYVRLYAPWRGRPHGLSAHMRFSTMLVCGAIRSRATPLEQHMAEAFARSWGFDVEEL